MPAIAPKRKLASWIDAFIDFTESKRSPLIFGRWAAITAIAAACERRVWVRTTTGALYPNLYIFLISLPGVGKTNAIDSAELLVRSTEELITAPSNLSSASLIDALNEAKRRIVNLNAPYMEFNSLFISSGELSALLPVYDPGFMATLTDIYDNRPFKEWKRGGNLRIDIPKPQLNLLGGGTPEYLNNFLPSGAWGQGFMSRVIMVYCGEPEKKSLFNGSAQADEDKAEWQILLHDLKAITDLCGAMTFLPDVKDLIQNWDDAGGPPTPEHSKLSNYNTRRTAHLLKLCIIACVSRSNDLEVNKDDFQIALGWLSEAEAVMPEIFKSMRSGGTDSGSIEETYSYVYKSAMANGGSVYESSVVMFLQERVPAHAVMRIIDLMVKGRMLEKTHDKIGRASYKPTPKQTHAVGI